MASDVCLSSFTGDPEESVSDISEIHVGIQSLEIQGYHDDTVGKSLPDFNHSEKSFVNLDETSNSSIVTSSTPLRKLPLLSSFTENQYKIPRKEHLQEDYQEINQFYLITSSSNLEIAVEKTQHQFQVYKRVSYADIGGLNHQLKLVQEAVEVPMKNSEFLNSCGLQPPRGILLFGPPGTGKTLIAKAVATETKAHFITINGPEIYSKFYGETEARLRNIFQEAIERAPTIIFIDEIDALCTRKDGASSSDQEKRVLATLLTLLDNLPTHGIRRVLLLAATNKPDALEPALRRPGRLDREIEIGIPTATERIEILTKLLLRVKHLLTDADIITLAEAAHGFTGADLAAVCCEGIESQIDVTHLHSSLSSLASQPSLAPTGSHGTTARHVSQFPASAS
ncbi:spermatogenesis-associated protein 5-like [Limulus polyphemus]|uniref:Spermatogenesis-associated protein 5-like n=1 Tax=Limulus polyphemus TaxID=6850 RepID=A0ABM1C0I0_LIMPO|nr:spermatogenesis-associated protein 5-like [Limulus polyphemus]